MSKYQRFSLIVNRANGAQISAGWFESLGVFSGATISEYSIDGGAWQPLINDNGYYRSGNIPIGPLLIGIRVREGGERIYELGSVRNAICFISSQVEQYEMISDNISGSSTIGLTLIQSPNNLLDINTHEIEGVSIKDAKISGGQTHWTPAEISSVAEPLSIIFSSESSGLPCSNTLLFNTIHQPLSLTATFTKTNPTTKNGSDGSIITSVINGSGNFSHLWDDGATTKDRANLISGDYGLTITDEDSSETFYLQTTLSEPVSSYPNTFVEISPINPIRFKVIDIGNDMPLEKYNFCELPIVESNKPFTPEIFNIEDDTKLQLISDYEINYLRKTNIDTGLEEELTINLVVDNLTSGQEFNGVIKDRGTWNGNSSIKIKIPSGEGIERPEIGSLVSISNSINYNGTYSVVDIFFTSIVLNTPFISEEPATIKLLSKIRYNIYEAGINFIDWGVGKYKLVCVSGENGSETDKLESEFISVEPYTPNTLLLTYTNIDIAYKVDWTTGIQMKKRHLGNFIKAVPTRDSTSFRNSNDNPAVLNSYVRNIEEYRLYELAWYAIQRLALIYSCDSFYINGKKMFVEELPETEQSEMRYMLGNQVLSVEQVGWLDNQNTHDIGEASEDVIVIGSDSDEVLGV